MSQTSSPARPDRSEVAERPSGASRVAAGMAVSRLFGFLREMVLAFFFGAGPHADVFRTALRGPNLLQNLLGEQTLSASFIPVYSRLIASGREEDAGRFAGAIFGLLLAAAAGLTLIGILLAEPIVAILAPGYLGDAAGVATGELTADRYPLAVRCVRIIFPMSGVLVLSAWALGVLNSHRRFLIPYLAPAAWNAAIIAALLVAGRYAGFVDPGTARSGAETDIRSVLLLAACIGALIGGILQFGVQLPSVARVLRGFRLSASTRVDGVRESIRAFAPLAAGRGAVQLSSYLDHFLASFLAAGAVGALGWSQTLYLLPIGLFGASVAAAELPEIARRSAVENREEMLSRVGQGLQQMSFFTVPTAVGYLVFGFLVVGGLFRRGQFGTADNWLVYLVLCGYSLGLVASTASRLMNNVFYALGKTRVPARIAVERVVLSAALGVTLMFWLDRYRVGEIFGVEESGTELFLGAVGLSLGSGLSSWYELRRLRASLHRLLGKVPLAGSRIAGLLGIAAISCLPASGFWYLLAGRPQLPLALSVVVLFAMTYLGLTWLLGMSELGRWLGRARRR